MAYQADAKHFVELDLDGDCRRWEWSSEGGDIYRDWKVGGIRCVFLKNVRKTIPLAIVVFFTLKPFRYLHSASYFRNGHLMQIACVVIGYLPGIDFDLID